MCDVEVWTDPTEPVWSLTHPNVVPVDSLSWYVCGKCGKKLFRYLANGEILVEMKCPRCKSVEKVVLTKL